MMFGRMHTRKWDPKILFPNGMGLRALLIVGVQYKQWDPGIVFSPVDFNFFGKQVWEMDYPLNKVILIRVVQQQAWWFLSIIFMASQRLEVGKQSANFKESYRKQVLQHPCLKFAWGQEILGREDFSCPKFFIGSQWHNHIFHIHEFVKLMLRVK